MGPSRGLLQHQLDRFLADQRAPAGDYVDGVRQLADWLVIQRTATFMVRAIPALPQD